MTDHTEETSPARQFAPLAIILGIPLLFAAIFFYTSPVVLETGGEQGIFKCGSPSAPNSDAENVCDRSEKIQRNKAIYSGLSGAALLGLGAVWMLRGRRHDDEWDDEDTTPHGRGGDIDLRADDERDHDRGRGDRPRSGAPARRGRPKDRARRDDDDEAPLRGVDRERGRPGDEDVDVDDSRAARRRTGGRRSVLRDDDFADPAPRRRADDDFADPAPRRRADDDWSSDGWR